METREKFDEDLLSIYSELFDDEIERSLFQSIFNYDDESLIKAIINIIEGDEDD